MNRTDSKALSIYLCLLYACPLCIYLQNLFFVSSNTYDAIYMLFTCSVLVFFSKGKLKVEGRNLPLILFLISEIIVAIASNNFLLLLQTTLLLFYLCFSDNRTATYVSGLQIFSAIGLMCAIFCIFEFINYDAYYSIISKFFSQKPLQNIQICYRVDHCMCGIMPQTSHAAGCILNSAIVLLYLRKEKENKIWVAVRAVVLLLGLLLTGKRAHILFGIIAAMISELIYSQRQTRTTKVFKYTLIGLIVVTVLYVLLPLFSEQNVIVRLFYTFRNIGTDTDVTSGRLSLYQDAIEMIKNNPLFGSGRGTFKLTHGTDVHNVYLQVLAENGVIVFALFVVTIVSNLIISGKTLSSLSILSVDQGDLKNDVGLMKFAFFSQLFFALYSFTGNCLYNIDFWAVYVLAVGISYVVMRNCYEKSIHYNN